MATAYTNPSGMVSDGLQSYDTATGLLVGRSLEGDKGLVVTNGDGIASNPSTYINPCAVAGCYNIGFKYTGNVAYICAANTGALSDTNKGFVTLQSISAAGALITVPVTENVSFGDDASFVSAITNNTFGVAPVLWSYDMPFYIYAVLSDDQASVCFAISRVPHLKTSPAASKFSKRYSGIADTQGSMFAFGDPTVSLYDLNPCLCIGSFFMRKTGGATADWTVVTPNKYCGIGNFLDGVRSIFPPGNSGCSSQAGTNSYLRATAGTAPQLGGYAYYYISSNGRVHYEFSTSVSVSGVTGAACYLTMPLRANYLYGSDVIGYCALRKMTSGSVMYSVIPVCANGYECELVRHGSAVQLYNTDFAYSTVGDRFYGTLDYSASIL